MGCVSDVIALYIHFNAQGRNQSEMDVFRILAGVTPAVLFATPFSFRCNSLEQTCNMASANLHLV